MDVFLPCGGVASFIPDFKPGDMPPTGYIDWQAWAEVQARAGLKQTQCPGCGLWRFPHELSPVKRKVAKGQTAEQIAAGEAVQCEDVSYCLKCEAAARTEGGR